MPDAPSSRLWKRTRRLTAGLLAAWLLLSVAGPWFARDLNAWQAFGFPLGYWLAAQGALLGYLVMLAVYLACMARLEARFRAESAAEEGRAPR